MTPKRNRFDTQKAPTKKKRMSSVPDCEERIWRMSTVEEAKNLYNAHGFGIGIHTLWKLEQTRRTDTNFVCILSMACKMHKAHSSWALLWAAHMMHNMQMWTYAHHISLTFSLRKTSTINTMCQEVSMQCTWLHTNASVGAFLQTQVVFSVQIPEWDTPKANSYIEGRPSLGTQYSCKPFFKHSHEEILQFRIDSKLFTWRKLSHQENVFRVFGCVLASNPQKYDPATIWTI